MKTFLGFIDNSSLVITIVTLLWGFCTVGFITVLFLTIKNLLTKN